MKTLAIVGCGKLGKIVARAVNEGFLPEYKLIAAYSRTYDKTLEIASYADGCTPCRTLC